MNNLLTLLKNQSFDSTLNFIETLSNANWQNILDLSVKHGISPQLYIKLNQSYAAQVPSPIYTELQQHYKHTAYNNLFFYQSLVGILDHLQSYHIDIIALKGMHLFQYIYEDLARPMADIDLLVHQADLPQIDTILCEMGYTPPTSTEKQWHQNKHFHWVYRAPNKKFIIELHWHIQRPHIQSIEINQLWHHAEVKALGAHNILVLCPEHLLIHLCSHMAQHSFQLTLRHLYDIAYVIHYYQDSLSWDTLLKSTHEWQLHKSVYLSLYLAKDLLDTPIPELVLRSLHPKQMTTHIITTAKRSIISTTENPFAELSSVFVRCSQLKNKTTSSHQGSQFEKFVSSSQAIKRYSQLLILQCFKIPIKQVVIQLYQQIRFETWLKKN